MHIKYIYLHKEYNHKDITFQTLIITTQKKFDVYSEYTNVEHLTREDLGIEREDVYKDGDGCDQQGKGYINVVNVNTN